MAQTTIKEYAVALFLAVQESKPEEHELVIENLVGVLKNNAQLELFAEIVTEFERLTNEQSNVKQVEVTFAREVSSNKKILDELNSVIGPKLEVRAKVDNELVGGMVLRVDDTLIDASIKGQLQRMKKDLSE